MRRSRKWVALIMAAIMIVTMMPIAQAEEALPTQKKEQTSTDLPGGVDPVDPLVQPIANAEGVTASVYNDVYRNLAAGLSYEWSEEPEASYPDVDNKLTDGKYGANDRSDKAWVGHHLKKTREVVFDLGDKKSITAIKAHFLEDWPSNNVLLPLTVSMYVSDDKVNWGLLKDNATQKLWNNGKYDETYQWDGSKDGIKPIGPDAKIAYARYVKVMFSMHPSAMTLVDEIEIIGQDGQAAGAVTVPSHESKLLAPGEATAGIEDLGLLYNGHYAGGKGDWSKDRIIPNISYVDKVTKQPTEWLFDGVLYLGTNSPEGRSFGAGSGDPSILADWKWYLNKTFAADGDMKHLNDATVEVSVKLGEPNHKTKVVLMIPYPDEGVSNFGDLGDGNLNFTGHEPQALSNRAKATQWYINEVKNRWAAGKYSNLDLVGMYWLEEQIGIDAAGPELIKAVSGQVHADNMKFFWIPHFLAYKAYMWKDVGFDAVAFQPNYFFEPTGYDRFEDASNIAKRYGMTNEFEFDDRMLTDGVFRERYIDYLNSGVETGLMANGFNAYYQGNNAVYDSAVSTDPANRVLYDWLRDYVKGTYSVNNAAPPEVEVQMNGKSFEAGQVLADSEKVAFTWNLKDAADPSVIKVSAMYDGKPYTAGTEITLKNMFGKHMLDVTVTSGKSKKTSFTFEVKTDAATMIALVDSYVIDGKMKNNDAAALKVDLEAMKQAEGGVNPAEFTKSLKSFNTKLDQLKKNIAGDAYATLKESVYYLAGSLAQGKSVEVSSVEYDNPNYIPSHAVDGFQATRWASSYNDANWFLVDLGQPTAMDTVRISWEGARADTYKLLVSDDKEKWTNVMPNDGIIKAQDGKETVQFKPVTARYIKFEGVKRATGYGYSFYEFGVYSLSDQPASLERNLALGLPYTWSQAPEASRPDDQKKLTDGKYAKMVNGKPDFNDSAWVGHLRKKTREVVFDLGDKKSISKIKAHFLESWPTNNVLVPLTVSMYVSDDKVNWGLLKDSATQELWRDGTYDETYQWDGSKDGIKASGPDQKIAYARYVKVTFTMHTRAMTFVDEIEILGEDGKAAGAVTVPTQTPKFLAAGEATAGIEHLGLLYNGQYANDLGTWTKERIIPNISYVDKDGKIKDRLFDGVLYLGINSPNPGRDFGGRAYLEDWKWYLDKTFAVGGDMDALNAAAKEVSDALNEAGVKEKVVLMIPDPGESITNFGAIEQGGESLNFNDSVGKEKALANREKAVQWWLQQVKSRWEAKGYANLELVGMYWFEEQISTSQSGPDLIRKVSDSLHGMKISDQDLKFFWIPHFFAYKAFMWKDVGFDAVTIQPNYFFEPTDKERLEDSANLAKQYGMSNELEFDDRMLTDGVFRERYIDYLNNGAKTGLMTEGFKSYYQGNNAVYNTAVSKDPATRVLYDWLYQFVKGTYKENYDEPSEVNVQMNGKKFQSGVKLPDSESVSFTWKLQEDDGLTKVTATYDGKPYTAGTVIPLAGKLGKHELVITVTAGKMVKTSYVIEATTNASGIQTLVDRFQKAEQFTNPTVAPTLNNYLEMMKRNEGVDAAQVTKYLKGFNTKLDEFKKAGTIKDEAYNTLKESVYYLTGNLAQGKTVEASSTEGNNANYAPAKAVDGFPASRWSSEIVDNTWFQVDLGKAVLMDTVRIDWEYARAKTYKLLVSNDKLTWKNVMPNDGVITAHDGKETVQFSPISARYIKFQGVERNTDYGYSFYEFGVYNLSGAVDMKAIDGVQATIDNATRKVTINGLVMNADQSLVNLKVFDPHGKINYEEQKASTANGKIEFAFTIKAAVQGNYDAFLSIDGKSESVKVSFVYNKKSDPNPPGNPNNGPDGNSTTPTPAPVNIQPQADGSVKATVSTKLDGTTAVGTISEQDLKAAITGTKADASGKQTVIVELKKNGNAAGYALDLPASFLAENPNLVIEVSTPNASAVLNGQMFAKSELGKQVRVIVSAGDRKSLNAAAQAQVGNRPIVQLSVQMDGKSVAWKNDKASVLVKVPYVLTGKESASSIGVLWINDQGVATVVKGAVYSAADKQLRFQANQAGVYAVSYMGLAASFTDLGKHAWAQEAVEQLASLGIVQGTSAAEFSPAEQVSRADFVLMLVRALNLKAEAGAAFTDVDAQAYYHEAVAIAKQLGIVTGTNGDQFAPKAKISRQDMMVMAARALAVAQAKELKGDLTALDSFKDAGKVADYAADSIAGMIEQGLIQGNNGLINPSGNTTRAETAVFLSRLLKVLAE
ncbi:DUF4855 domain-containing protein [Paenibacillus terrigena]|uniref:DUF4855 domain-containing protein n=1 Tax=Paenibacillus terrigena TaxID=369333 RepID=UPI00039B5D7B|nr:DUF4855 domain-containing protein [Paenibacillus terrigena]